MRFGLQGGRLIRRRPRRRWPVGQRGARVARALGFRYSIGRHALVPRALDGRFGPVLYEIAPAPPIAARERTLDLTVAPLPHPHLAATLWQLTAVDTRSLRVWADVVRHHRRPPTIADIARLTRRIVHELQTDEQQLETLIVDPELAGWLGRSSLPGRPRLVVRSAEDEQTSPAAAAHERVVEDYWRDTLDPLAAPPLEHLRRGLARCVAACNASGTGPASARARRSQPRSLGSSSTPRRGGPSRSK